MILMKPYRQWMGTVLWVAILSVGISGVCYMVTQTVVLVRGSAAPITIARFVALAGCGAFLCLEAIERLQSRGTKRPYAYLASAAFVIAVLLEILGGKL
jgi:hypothetical protein